MEEAQGMFKAVINAETLRDAIDS
ncbi:MAG: hypothetical protein QG575_1514, partial [Euryarchaeota archaeon]|nr:hypothetical protein [Euryarchaeota archaeon]